MLYVNLYTKAYISILRNCRSGRNIFQETGMSGYGRGGQGYRNHRGGRSYKGYGRGRGQSHAFEDGENNHAERDRDFGGQRRGGGRGRPPPGLKGREIGLWYAAQGKAKKEREEKQQRPVVHMNKTEETKIRSVLNDFSDGASEARPLGNSVGATLSGSQHTEESQSSDFQSQCNVKKESGYGKDWFDNNEESASDCSNPSSIKSERNNPLNINKHMRFTKDNDTAEESKDVDAFKELLEVSKFESDFMEFDSKVDGDFCDTKPSSELDRLYHKELECKKDKPEYRNMLKFRENLPSFKMRGEIISTLNRSQVAVISGETGCGKTTQVPQFILDEEINQGRGSQCHVICTQPRRISAISVAERVAKERAVKIGGEDVGYMIRLESRLPRPRGSLLFCTTGCVLKFLESDPSLSRATHIIIDEIHERDLQSDFLMIILKDLLPIRPDLKVVLMSATLNAEMFSKYFFDCPMIHIPGFTYPVEEYYVEDVIDMLNYQAEPSRFRQKRLFGEKRRKEEARRLQKEEYLKTLTGKYSMTTINSLRIMDDNEVDLKLVANLIRHIVQDKPDGAILVFVPGWAEISDLNKLLLGQPMFNSSSFRIIPLHSLMPTVNQKHVFERPPSGVRKIVIATNIAETSITIDDVVYVIDGGKIKVKDFEPENNLSTLESKQVSKANAKQRRGRAGRVQPGICYRLYTKHVETQMIDYFPPEMLRTRLEEICLQIKILKLGKILPFVSKAMQPPSINALNHAVTTLQDLNALDKDEELLPLGYHLARMPVDPHTGKMILFGAMFSCLDPVLSVAASLSFKNAFYTPLGKEREADEARKYLSADSSSDHILLINAMRDWEQAKSRNQERQFCHEFFLSISVLKLLRDMKGQLAKLLHEVGFTSSSNPNAAEANIYADNLSLVKAVVCAGLYPNVAKIGKIPKQNNYKNQTVKVILKGGQKASLHPVSVNSKCRNFKSKWIIFHQKLKTSDIYIHDCTTISPYPLLFFGGEIKLVQDEGDCVTVDDWIVFKAVTDTAQLVKDLRHQLDRLLKQKITKPGPTDWSSGSKEGALMKVILDLITKEDQWETRNRSRNDHFDD